MRIDDTVLEPATVTATGPALVQPVVTTVEDVRQVPLALDWGEPLTAPAPAMGGLVSEVLVEPGDTVETGTAVVAVDGARLVATSEFLSGPVTPRSTDDQTGRVARLLVAAGHLEDPDVGWDHRVFYEALDAFQEANGLPDVNRFDPSWVVWIPRETFVVQNIQTGVGRPLPAVGAPLLEGPALLVAVRPVPEAGSVLASPQGIYQVTLAGTRLAEWDLGLPVPERLVTRLDDELDPGVDVITVDAALQNAREVMTVPVSAVVTDQTGATCLEDEEAQLIPVEVVASTPGAVDLVPVDGIGAVHVDPSPRSSCAE